MVPSDVPGRKEIVSGIKTLFGPASAEFGQLVADQVRFWRWRSALKIMRRASEIRVREGLTGRRIPLKFFLEFIEEASKENEESEITELWARLLAGSTEASTGFDLVCVDILKAIGSAEASILKSIWNNKPARQYNSDNKTETALNIVTQIVKITRSECKIWDLEEFLLKNIGYFAICISIENIQYHWMYDWEDAASNEIFRSYRMECHRIYEELKKELGTTTAYRTTAYKINTGAILTLEKLGLTQERQAPDEFRHGFISNAFYNYQHEEERKGLCYLIWGEMGISSETMDHLWSSYMKKGKNSWHSVFDKERACAPSHSR